MCTNHEECNVVTRLQFSESVVSACPSAPFWFTASSEAELARTTDFTENDMHNSFDISWYNMSQHVKSQNHVMSLQLSSTYLFHFLSHRLFPSQRLRMAQLALPDTSLQTNCACVGYTEQNSSFVRGWSTAYWIIRSPRRCSHDPCCSASLRPPLAIAPNQSSAPSAAHHPNGASVKSIAQSFPPMESTSFGWLAVLLTSLFDLFVPNLCMSPGLASAYPMPARDTRESSTYPDSWKRSMAAWSTGHFASAVVESHDRIKHCSKSLIAQKTRIIAPRGLFQQRVNKTYRNHYAGRAQPIPTTAKFAFHFSIFSVFATTYTYC